MAVLQEPGTVGLMDSRQPRAQVRRLGTQALPFKPSAQRLVAKHADTDAERGKGPSLKIPHSPVSRLLPSAASALHPHIQAW